MFVCVRVEKGRGVGRTVMVLQVCVPVLVVPPQMQRPQQLRQVLHPPQNRLLVLYKSHPHHLCVRRISPLSVPELLGEAKKAWFTLLRSTLAPLSWYMEREGRWAQMKASDTSW
jgi:hypothetical protein